MPASRIWTIGHSTRSADEFLQLLQTNTIDGLADVRTIPKSRRHPHFGGAALAARLKENGIEYRHFAPLGGLRKPRPDSPNGAWRNQAFRGYADHMMTPDFAAGVDELLEFGERRNVAVMCAEAVWWQCHRMLLSDALVARDSGRAAHHEPSRQILAAAASTDSLRANPRGPASTGTPPWRDLINRVGDEEVSFHEKNEFLLILLASVCITPSRTSSCNAGTRCSEKSRRDRTGV